MQNGFHADEGKPRRILYVEDDTFLSALVEATLVDAGFAVEWHSTAEAALLAAADGGYDAYLLDLRLPRMDGVALAARLKQLTPGVPVVFVSGDDDALGKLRSALVVRKPFYENELLDVVTEALAGPTGAPV